MRVILATAAAALCLAACGTDEADDSWGPVSFKVYGGPAIGQLSPLQLRIDGEDADEVTRAFTDEQTFLDRTIIVELHDGAHVADSMTLDLSENAANCQYDGTEAEMSIGVCRYASGELRYATLLANFSGGTCTGDGFCYSRCGPIPSACAAGTKCGGAFSAADLRYSRAQCNPIGVRAVGETCTYAAGSDGRFVDDCDATGVCVAGTCRQLCANVQSCVPSGEVCTELPNHPPEVRVCLAQP